MIALALCSETVVDSAKMAQLQVLNMQVLAFFFCNRHQEAFFTRPQSMDNIRKSKSVFPVDVRLTLKIRLSIIHFNSHAKIVRNR